MASRVFLLGHVLIIEKIKMDSIYIYAALLVYQCLLHKLAWSEIVILLPYSNYSHQRWIRLATFIESIIWAVIMVQISIHALCLYLHYKINSENRNCTRLRNLFWNYEQIFKLTNMCNLFVFKFPARWHCYQLTSTTCFVSNIWT